MSSRLYLPVSEWSRSSLVCRVQPKAVTSGCCLLQRCLHFEVPRPRRPRLVELAAGRAVWSRCERSDTGRRTDRTRTYDRYGIAPSCTWGDAAVPSTHRRRVRTDIGRRSDTDHARRTLDTVPSCSGVARPSSRSETTGRHSRRPALDQSSQQPDPEPPSAGSPSPSE